MIIEQLIFNEDGTSAIEMVEVADNWYDTPELAVSETEQLRADVDYIAIMTGVEL